MFILLLFESGYIFQHLATFFQILKILKRNNSECVSLNTNILFLVGAISRIGWIWDSLLKNYWLTYIEIILAILTQCYIIYLYQKNKVRNYFANEIQIPFYLQLYVLLPLAIFLSLIFNPGDSLFSSQIFVSLSIFSEAIGLLPQLYIIKKSRDSGDLSELYIIFLGIAFIITYIVNTVLLKKDKKIIRINNLKELSEDSLSLMIIVLLTLMCATIINSLLFDSINACKLSYKMNKIKKIKETDFLLLSEKLKEINVVNIIKFKYTFWYNLIFFIVDILYSVLFILSFKDIYENNFINEINFHKFFIKSLRYYQVSVLVLLLISIVIMNRTKKSLLKNQYYNKNRIAQKIYNIYLNNLIYFTDIISFKLVSDLIMYIPTLLFLSQGKFHTTTLVISEFSILIYILLGGSFYLVIDKNNKAAKLSKKIKNLFCLKRIDFHFGEKDHNFTLDQTRFDYNLEEQNIINNLNMNVVKNIENNIFDEEDNFTMDEKHELNLDDDNYNLEINDIIFPRK